MSDDYNLGEAIANATWTPPRFRSLLDPPTTPYAEKVEREERITAAFAPTETPTLAEELAEAAATWTPPRPGHLTTQQAPLQEQAGDARPTAYGQEKPGQTVTINPEPTK